MILTLRLLSLCRLRRAALLFGAGLLAVISRAAEAPKRSFDIPAGDAPVTLRQFVAQSGAQVLYSVEEVEGVRTAATKGVYTVREALGRLLADTKLHAAQDERTGTLTIRPNAAASSDSARRAPSTDTARPRADAAPAAAEEAVRLEPFTVVSSGDSGYLHSTSTVATRANRATIEIPQSISVITEEFMRDTAVLDEGEAIAYVGNTFVRDQFTEPGNTIMRGFEREGEVYVDGFRDVTFRRDAAAYDRMEIVKGPPSAVQGRSGSSGLINWVTKKPNFGRDFLRSTLLYGGFDDEMVRVVLDGNRTFRDQPENKIGARAVAIYQRGDSWIDQLPNDTRALYPSFRWQHRGTEMNVFGGLLESASPSRDIGSGPAFFAKAYRDTFSDPALGGDPRDPISALNIRYGANPVGPDSVRNDRVGTGVATISHRFGDVLYARQGYQFLTASHDRIWYDPTALTTQVTTSYLGVPGVWLPVARGGNERVEHRHALQGDLVADYAPLKAVRAVTMVGYEWWYSHLRNNAFNLAVAPEFLRVNLAAPFRTDAEYWQRRITAINVSSRNRERVHSLSYYVQQEFDVRKRLLLQAAWRHDTQDTFRRNTVSGALLADAQDATDSIRFGGTVFLNRARSLAVYGVYSDQKNPSQSRDQYSNLNRGDPRIDDRLEWDPAMELIEVGLKGEFLNRRLSLMLAYFNMTKTGNLNTISNVPMESMGELVFAGVASIADSTNQGWEMSAVGNVGRGISFTANLSFNDSNEKRVFGTTLIDQRIHRVPDYDMNLFAKWDLRRGQRDGFSIRAGMNRYADFEGTFNGVRTTLTKPFTKYDAGLNYRLGRHSIDLFVRNLTDEPIILFRGGAPRGVRLTVNSTW